MKDIIIIGGGLAGLVSSMLLKKAGFEVMVIEKKGYPFHRVCGEYISNEVRDFLLSEDLYPTHLAPAEISKFRLSSPDGNVAEMPLDLGGFGVSRYALDDFLYQKALALGVHFLIPTQVLSVTQEEDHFTVETNRDGIFKSKLVIGAFGKRSRLDKQLERRFINQRSPYIGVKYHIKLDYDADVVALHNFQGGYCGINRVENDTFNLCYLGSQKSLKKYGNIPDMEAQVLWKNPHLKAIFQQAEFLFEKPEVINEVSFAAKKPVEKGVFMTGDAAGLITPLCGNGMALAIHSAKLLSELIIKHEGNHPKIVSAYTRGWNALFKQRLWTGRQLQRLFGSSSLSNLAVGLVKNSHSLSTWLMKQTHGQPI